MRRSVICSEPLTNKHRLWSRYFRGLTALVVVLLSACGDSETLKPLGPEAVILAFGDSLTHGTGAAADESYPQVLAERTGLEVVNAGIPGELSAAGLKRLPRELEKNSPALVILIHGGNDLLQRKSKQAAADNLIAMIDMIRESKAQVVMAGVPNFGLLLSTAELYLEVAEQRKVPIEADILPSLLQKPSTKSDTVHPNAKGYRELAEALEDLLRDNGALP